MAEPSVGRTRGRGRTTALVAGGLIVSSAIIYGDTFGLLFAVASLPSDNQAACRGMGRAGLSGVSIMLAWTVFASAPLAVWALRRRTRFWLYAWILVQLGLLIVAAGLIVRPPGLFCFDFISSGGLTSAV